MNPFSSITVSILLMAQSIQIGAYPAADGTPASGFGSNFTNGSQGEPAVGTIIGHCLMEPEISRCFKKRIIERLDRAIKDNDTWQLNDYVVVEKDPEWKSPDDGGTDYRDLNSALQRKFEELVESRMIRMKMTSKSAELEGRKKKDKGGFAMMGGIALAGMMAQLFMGKIVMVAGAALILSKIALLLSVVNALKKGVSGSEHVVYSGGGGGGGQEGGWHRSLPRYNEEQYDNRYPDEG